MEEEASPFLAGKWWGSSSATLNVSAGLLPCRNNITIVIVKARIGALWPSMMMLAMQEACKARAGPGLQGCSSPFIDGKAALSTSALFEPSPCCSLLF
jgi:hypothetical protein